MAKKGKADTTTWIEPLCGLNFPLDVADGDAAALLGVEVAGHLQEQIHSPCPAPFELSLVVGWCRFVVILLTLSPEVAGKDDRSFADLCLV